MKPQSAKAKGRRLQQWMCQCIQQRLGVVPEDCRSCSMGAGGEDILMSREARRVFPYSVECKNRENHNIWVAYLQCEGNAPPGVEPILCIKRNKSKPLVVLDAEHFVDLVARAGGGRPEPEPEPEPAPEVTPTPTPEPGIAIDVVLSETCIRRR